MRKFENEMIKHGSCNDPLLLPYHTRFKLFYFKLCL